MQFTITATKTSTTPTVGKRIPSYNRPKAPNVEEAVRTVTGETPIVSQILSTVWKWKTWTHEGFAYAHPNG